MKSNIANNVIYQSAISITSQKYESNYIDYNSTNLLIRDFKTLLLN